MDSLTFLSWSALVCVIGQLWFMGSHKYRVGWWLALAACVAWSVFSIMTGAWALLVQQILIAGLAVRGLLKLKEIS